MSTEMTIDGTVYVPKSSVKAMPKMGKVVLVRTYSAGVHIGVMPRKWAEGNATITLKNASRLYRWRGANTLNEVAMHGVNRDEYTRISEAVPEIMLLPIEVIPVAEGVDLSAVWCI